MNFNIGHTYMRSIIGRVGGKSKLKDAIIKLIPKHNIYVEAFVGGGAVFFGKEPSATEVVNDLDPNIFHIYSDMKSVGEKMINKDFKPTREKFNRFKNQKTFKTKSERLYRNLYLSLNSFRSDRKNYVGEKEAEIYRKNSETGKKYKNTDYKDRLKDVTITNKDWKRIINKYDGNDTFFYLDPPYSMASDNKDYENNDISIDELYDTLKNIKGKFLLSYDHNKEIKNKFKGFRVRTVKTKYETMGVPINKKEYLISNY
jgi:DNA adenine methylase